jgi:hypothetical protein
MCMSTLAYTREHYQSFPRSSRHIMQLIGSHQSPQTGWAYLSYDRLSFEASLTRRRVIQLVALLEAGGVLEVRRGHGRGHVNFYRILREEDGLPVPRKREKKVKSATPPDSKKVKFPTPPEPEKVKSQLPKSLESFSNVAHKVLTTKEREDKGQRPVSLSVDNEETKRCGWGGCEAQVCPHEVNFCARHADCEECARDGTAEKYGTLRP